MTEPQSSAAAAGPSYPGERLGFPEQGPGSVAGWGRRIAALFIDWFASMLTVATFIGAEVWTGRGLSQWGPMAVFLLEVTVLTALLGGSFGQILLRVVVVRLDGRTLTLLAALLRTFLICLVIPPLVYNRDRRGLHDLAVGSIAVHR